MWSRGSHVWSRISSGFLKRFSNTCVDLVYFHSQNHGDSNRTNYRGQNCVVLVLLFFNCPSFPQHGQNASLGTFTYSNNVNAGRTLATLCRVEAKIDWRPGSKCLARNPFSTNHHAHGARRWRASQWRTRDNTPRHRKISVDFGIEVVVSNGVRPIRTV